MRNIRQKIINDLLTLAKNPYGKYSQTYEVNGHVIDFSFSQRMMYAVSIDSTYAQVHEKLLGNKCIVEVVGEELTEIQYILHRLELDYSDVEY